jgi:hypothetical protein
VPATSEKRRKERNMSRNTLCGSRRIEPFPLMHEDGTRMKRHTNAIKGGSLKLPSAGYSMANCVLEALNDVK